MTSSIRSRRKSRRKSDRKSRRKLRRKLRRKTKRKYRKQGGTKSSKRRAKRNRNTEKRNRRTTAKDSSDRRWRERNDPDKTLRMLNQMTSTAGRDGDVLARFALEPHYLMSADERTALTKRMLYDKRFGQKGDNELVDKARVAFMPTQVHPNIPTIGIGQQLFEGDIRELITCQGLNLNQRREFRRLVARLHLAALDDYDLGLTLNPQPTTLQQRQVILQPLWPWGRETATGENLPYPLQIMRKSRRYHIAVINPNYPTRANGEIDETDDMFWPTTREQIFNFMKDIPTLQELEWFGL